MAQLVKDLTSAQVMISWSVSSSPTSGSVLTAQSLEPALDSVSPSLSAPPPLTLCLSLKNKQTLKKKKSHVLYRLSQPGASVQHLEVPSTKQIRHPSLLLFAEWWQ